MIECTFIVKQAERVMAGWVPDCRIQDRGGADARWKCRVKLGKGSGGRLPKKITPGPVWRIFVAGQQPVKKAYPAAMKNMDVDQLSDHFSGGFFIDRDVMPKSI
jgi:hypothetical protein